MRVFIIIVIHYFGFICTLNDNLTWRTVGTYTNTLQLNNTQDADAHDIYIIISIDAWSFYHVRFIGTQVKKYMIRERHYSSTRDGDYININFNSWDANAWLGISGIYNGNAITAKQVEITVLAR